MTAKILLVPIGRKVSIKNKNLINEKRLFRAFLRTLSSDFWPLAGKAPALVTLGQSTPKNNKENALLPNPYSHDLLVYPEFMRVQHFSLKFT